ncbi:MAG: class II aldolase/adducin family protein [Gemmatimonadales bacterium]
MITTDEDAARDEIARTARALHARGLSVATTGNVSRRCGDGMLITPSGTRYDALTPDQIVLVRGDGTVVEPGQRPSSEWRFHLAAYDARPDRAAVVHCHSPHATMLACTRRAIPAFHYLVTIAGGEDIPCVRYADFGSPELATHVAAGLAERDACLLAHHGQVALGRSLAAALDLAWIVEDLARVYHGALLLGEVPLLDADQVARARERIGHYRDGIDRP